MDNVFSQGQMAMLFELPEQDVLNNNRKVKVLAAPAGLHDIEYDINMSKEDYINSGFYEVKVGIAPIRTQSVNRYMQCQRKQYALKHRVTSTIHACMEDTLQKVAMKVTDLMFKLWDKGQIVVALTRTKFGKNIIVFGEKEETVEAIVRLVQIRSQWTDFMENVLDLINENDNNPTRVPTLTQSSFPFQICDIALPHCKIGFLYFLI